MEAHFVYKLFTEWPFQDMNILHFSININRLYNISIINRFERRVDKCFIKI